jgi:3-methyl-2-oxobutanoate hydroxymethyltransferase
MRTTILDLQKMKKNGQRIPMVTAYDATGAHWVEAAGIPAILVGDSLGMVVQGHETTLPVTLDEMIYHTRMVVRGTSKALIIADMPFLTYQTSIEQAITSAGRLMKEGGATAVKLEGGAIAVETVRRLVQIGIPVMAHVGLTPQSVHAFGGFRVQGKDEKSAERILQDAEALEEAGAFAIVLETMPAPLGQRITEHLHIPTIGIGAGPNCDGQIQVFHDLLGLIDGFTPRHARHYAELGTEAKGAIEAYMKDVQIGSFPDAEHSFGMETAVTSVYGTNGTHKHD